MDRFIKQVTLTGADTRTDYEDLHQLSRRYPFVEWGILLSLNSEGSPRFPKHDWIEDFFVSGPSHVQTSGHLCGTWVRDIIAGGREFLRTYPDIAWRFNRIQLNFHGIQHFDLLYSISRFQQSLFALSMPYDRPIIFQIDGVNTKLYEITEKWKVIREVQALHDISGGAGILPGDWPAPIGRYCGYAGGLSPENLRDQLDLIKERLTIEAGSLRPIWIDAETHLRSLDNIGSYFDLDKVEQFLSIASDYVI